MRVRKISLVLVGLSLTWAGGRSTGQAPAEPPWFGGPAELSVARARAYPPLLHAATVDTTRLSLTASAVMVNDDRVLEIANGRIEERHHLSEMSPLLPELQDALEEELNVQERRHAMRGTDFERRLTAIVHRELPYQTVAEAIYTATVAGVRTWAFPLVTSEDAWTIWEMRGLPLGATSAPAATLHIVARSDGISLSMTNADDVIAPDHAALGPEPGCDGDQPAICLSPFDDATRVAAHRLLYNRLSSLRAAAGTSSAGLTVVLMTSPETPWQSVIDLVETTRWQLAQPSYDRDDAFESAPLGTEQPLFEPSLGPPAS